MIRCPECRQMINFWDWNVVSKMCFDCWKEKEFKELDKREFQMQLEFE